MKSPTRIIAGAMQVLSVDVQTQDGVANAALREASERLTELDELINDIKSWDIKCKIDDGRFKIPIDLRKRIQAVIET